MFEDKVNILPNVGGFLVPFEVKSILSGKEIEKQALNVGIKLRVADELSHEGWPCIFLSCSGVDEQEFGESMRLLKQVLF